jgi:hypothetical protein
MTLAEVSEIFAYWERNPPAHLIVQTIARLLGWAPRSIPTASPRPQEIAASAPPGLAVTQGGASGLPVPVLDPVVLRARNRARAAELARSDRNVGAMPLSQMSGCS